MKNICRILTVVVVLVSVLAYSAGSAFALGGSHKDQKTFGFMGLGYYEISNYDSLYVSFATSSLKAAGLGFETFFEYGLADKFGLNFAAGYDRLLYANKFKALIAENYFLIDITGHYYFNTEGNIQPYLAGGAGGEISSKGAAPVLDLGGGIDFMVSDAVSVRFQTLFKTAIIHNRAEAGLGIAYHF